MVMIIFTVAEPLNPSASLGREAMAEDLASSMVEHHQTEHLRTYKQVLQPHVNEVCLK